MLTVNQQNMDLGTLKRDVPFPFKFILSNNTSKEITVTKIVVGCGSCTKASMKHSVIHSNNSAELDVIFTPASTGINRKQITVHYAEGGIEMDAMVLKFHANVTL